MSQNESKMCTWTVCYSQPILLVRSPGVLEKDDCLLDSISSPRSFVFHFLPTERSSCYALIKIIYIIESAMRGMSVIFAKYGE